MLLFRDSIDICDLNCVMRMIVADDYENFVRKSFAYVTVIVVAVVVVESVTMELYLL